MEYAGPYAYGFGEQNGVVNGENGLYLGMEYQASNEVKISTSCNEFTLPSTGAFTTTGAEYLIRCEGALAKSVNLFLQFKDNSKSQESIILDAESDPQKIFEERDQENLRASCSFALNKWSEIVQRIELTTVSYSISQRRSTGVLMFTEVNLFPPHRCFYGTARMVFFDTQSYDSRMYEYESDVRGGYSFPPLYGRGSRWYIVAGWKAIQHLEFSFKYSETFQTASVSTNSGNSQGVGPLNNRVTFQMDVVL